MTSRIRLINGTKDRLMRMKRLILALCLLLAAGGAEAFDPAVPGPPVRIGILRAPAAYYFENAEHVQNAIRESLRADLRTRGYDVVLVDRRFDELSDAEESFDVDYFIEIAGDSRTESHGGVGVGAPHAAVSMGMLVADVGADLFVYDGATLEEIAHTPMSKRNKAFVPTSVGVGGAGLFAWIATPFIERAQVRSVARQLAKDIATEVDNVVRAR